MNQEFDKIAKGNKRVYNSNVLIRTRELNWHDIIACLTHWLLERFAKSEFFDILVSFRLDLGQITFNPVENAFAG